MPRKIINLAQAREARNEESPEMRLQRCRDEMRRLDNLRFVASIVLALVGVAAVGATLYWARNMAISTFTSGAFQ